MQVESNLDSVELSLNGQSLGSKNVVPLYHLTWDVKYSPGVLVARGSKNGRVVLTAARSTTGNPVKIKLTPDHTELLADGVDVGIIRVEVVDKEGRSVPTADQLVRFRITGDGKLLGVGNGDPNCHESDKKPERSLFSGLAVILVQAAKTPGVLIVEAASDGLESASVALRTRRTKLPPAVPEIS